MDKAEKVMGLAARRGFFWNAYEIYGGVSGFLVWGDLGTRMRRKVADLWRDMFIYRHGFVEIDSPVVSPYVVFKASGHVDSFKDYVLTCISCGRKFKADKLLEEAGVERPEALSVEEIGRLAKELNVLCPECGGGLGDASRFTTMFRTTIGPVGDDVGFARPETAQGMFTEFKRVYLSERKRIPLGIAQIGRALRNEISPRQGPIRLREFDLMEIELFYDPAEPFCPFLEDVKETVINILPEEEILKGNRHGVSVPISKALSLGYVKAQWLAYFMALAKAFMEKLGVPSDNQRFREKLEGERAHYALQTFDQEVLLSRWGWVEVSGHADRTNYDLSVHIREGGTDLTAERILKEPKVVKERRVKPRIDGIKRDFGEGIGSIMVGLSSIDEKDLAERLDSQGFVEVGGFRLDRHYFEEEVVEEVVHIEKFVPYVAEPSFGLDRITYSILEYSYGEKEDRVILSLPYAVSPVDAAVFPIVSKKKFADVANKIGMELMEEGFRVLSEVKESIGKRYARADEIGVPVSFTVDGQTLIDGTVTVRDRDSWRQVRLEADRCGTFLTHLLKLESFDEAAKRF